LIIVISQVSVTITVSLKLSLFFIYFSLKYFCAPHTIFWQQHCCENIILTAAQVSVRDKFLLVTKTEVRRRTQNFLNDVMMDFFFSLEFALQSNKHTTCTETVSTTPIQTLSF